MDKEQTNAVKGIFAGIIVFSHFRQYVTLSDTMSNALFIRSLNFLGQLMVVMFLVYSGYGIVISSKKNPNYFNSFLKHRILHTLLYFDLAIVLFLISGLILGNVYPVKRILLSLIAWDSVGNSNWFVFAVLYAYVSVFISAKLQGGRITFAGIMFVTAACLAYMLVMMRFKGSYWYNTIMTFPVGMFIGYYKDKIDVILKNHYYLCLLICGGMFILGYKYKYDVRVYEVYAIAFAVCWILITYKIKLNNAFLTFMGKYSFDIYLLQRIPAMLLKNLIGEMTIIYFAAISITTVLLAVIFHECSRRILSFLL